MVSVETVQFTWETRRNANPAQPKVVNGNGLYHQCLLMIGKYRRRSFSYDTNGNSSTFHQRKGT
jgi:hypothetical protein